jgi:hypothetical protein
MKRVITALQNQLKNFPGLSYASLNANVAEDTWDLVEKNKFPFFNILPDNKKILRGIDGVSRNELERHVFPITIQFACASMRLNVAMMGDEANEVKGILEFSDDIWDAINFDLTIGGTVDGILPGDSEIPTDYVKGEDSKFLAQAEIKIEFYRDQPRVS